MPEPQFNLRRGLGAALLASLCLLAPAAASANTITVDSTADPGAPGICTVRDAIIAANTNVAANGCTAGSGLDVVDASGIAGQITLTAALPNISTDIVVLGSGSDQLTITGADTYRPFNVITGATAAITDLTITHGFALFGGAISNTGTLTLNGVVVSNSKAQQTGSTNTFPEAGGIFNQGILHLILSSVIGNAAVATGSTNQNGPEGGGIYSQGTTSLDRSTVSGNQAMADAMGGATTNAIGGGILIAGGTTTIVQSTISGNSASATGGASSNSANGGGISGGNVPGLTLNIDRSTVTGNSVTAGSPVATAAGGGISADGTTFAMTSSTISGNSATSYANFRSGATTRTFKDSIIANPIGGGNCSAASTSQGYNIDSGTTCGFNQPTDQPSTDPLLGPLADNGGPTQTMLPQPNSPAIDKGQVTGETVDQRGLQRPWLFDITEPTNGDGSDIGAVEVEGPVPTGTTPASPNASGTPNVFGTVESGSTVQLFTGTSCGTQVGSGPASGFLSPGVAPSSAIPEGSTTFSVRSTYGTATSDCSPTTVDYTRLASPPSGGGGGGASPPDTSLSAKVRKPKHKATFTFASSDPSATFMCKLDKGAFAPCTSPVTIKKLRKGKHTFTVEAVNAAGPDPSPATFKFKLKL
jgi:hypothetical protein